MHKAIETTYKGYKMRSRLEARWAVFFDALGIKWEYEVEGFELPAGRYLPDFWLPQVSMWAEIKPIVLSRGEFIKCEQLARITGHSVLMFVGVPASVAYPAITGAEFEHGGWQAALTYYDLSDGNQYHLNESRFYYTDSDSIDFGCDFYSPAPAATDDIWQGLVFNYKRSKASDNQYAINAAKGARFEFGETP